MADSTPKSYATDPTLYLYTSLSSGSSHIVTATSRLETILKANKIPFRALDVATDEKARMLWGRRAGKRKLPGLVRLGMVVGDLDEVEEWNEYGEIQEQLGSSAPAPALTSTPTVSAGNTPSKASAAPKPPAAASTPARQTAASPPSEQSPAATKPTASATKSEAPKPPPGGVENAMALAMRQAGVEAAAQAKKSKLKPATAPKATPAESTAPKDGSISKELEQTGSKLDQSAVVPPPSGMTESEEATAPESDGAKKESEPETAAKKGAESDDAPSHLQPEAATSTSTATSALSGDVPPANRSPSETQPVSSDPDKSDPAETATPITGSGAHRVSSISTADKETIQAIESTTKIDEDPVAETDEARPEPEATESKSTGHGAAAAPSKSTSRRASSISAADKDTIGKIEQATKIDEDPEGEAVAETSKVKEGEPHVKFKGESPGTEIDRVKATLSMGSSRKVDGGGKTALGDTPAAAMAGSESAAVDGSEHKAAGGNTEKPVADEAAPVSEDASAADKASETANDPDTTADEATRT